MEGAYCSNCSIPVKKGQRESFREVLVARQWLIVAFTISVLLIGLGMALALFGAEMGMPRSQGLGFGLTLIGIIVLVGSVILFGWIKYH